jgi:hypothetical protein
VLTGRPNNFTSVAVATTSEFVVVCDITFIYFYLFFNML